MLKTRSKPIKKTTKKIQGMGATVHDKGVFFRVWAPHAQQVFVSGDFNDWSDNEHKMRPEQDGYWGLDIPAAKAGDQYKFILHNGDHVLHRNDPYARALTNSAGNSIVVDPHFDWEDQDYTIAPLNEWIIYELHVGTFNVKEKGKPGTFASVQEKLPYLKELGINAIEIMPPFEFPGGFSWGYNPCYPFAPESDYGGPQAFKELINAAHKEGIAIILDCVYNHFGPGDLDLWQFDGWSENEGGGIYFYQDDRSKTPWGNTRPDYGRPEVRQYLRDNALYWLEEFHVDSLRIDGTAFVRTVDGVIDTGKDLPDGWSLLKWINDEVCCNYPDRIMIAEDLKDNELVTHKDKHGCGFHTQWDTSFTYFVRKQLAEVNDTDRNMNRIADYINKKYNGDAFQRIIFTESHDAVSNGDTRVPEQIVPDDPTNWFARKRSILGAVLVFTSPGIPMIFQGQEMLEGGWFSDDAPLDWDNSKNFEGIIKLYRDLMHFRLNKEGLTKGLSSHQVNVFHTNNETNVIAFNRWHEGGPKDSVIVLINFSNNTYENYRIGMPEEGKWMVRFNSDWKGYDASFGNNDAHEVDTDNEPQDGLEYSAAIRLGPYNALILSRD